MLGYCGIDCSECDAYKATVRGDLSLLQKVAEKFSGGREPEGWVCLGCLVSDSRFMADYCASCKIRLCARGKDLANCAACEGYETCAVLHDFMTEESPELAGKMNLIRRAFLAREKQIGA